MKGRRLLALLLVLSGAALLGAAGLHYWRGFEAQRTGRRILEERQSARPREDPTPRENPGIVEPRPAVTPVASYPYGQPIARLKIASAGIDAIVFGGADPETLEKGPGHVPGSELPGERTGRNNCVITGHRDAQFRHLGWLRKGHRIELETPAGTVAYRVVSREIVTPETVRVLKPTERPRLTLITCYPFDYIGPAPRRLVVVAEPIAEPGASRHPS